MHPPYGSYAAFVLFFVRGENPSWESGNHQAISWESIWALVRWMVEEIRITSWENGALSHKNPIMYRVEKPSKVVLQDFATIHSIICYGDMELNVSYFSSVSFFEIWTSIENARTGRYAFQKMGIHDWMRYRKNRFVGDGSLPTMKNWTGCHFAMGIVFRFQRLWWDMI